MHILLILHILHILPTYTRCSRFRDIQNPKICPPQGKKAKNSDDYDEAEYLGVMVLDPRVTYDAHLHYAIAHMRRADGALSRSSA